MDTNEKSAEQSLLERVEASLKDWAEGKVTSYPSADFLIKEFGLETQEGSLPDLKSPLKSS